MTANACAQLREFEGTIGKALEQNPVQQDCGRQGIGNVVSCFAIPDQGAWDRVALSRLRAQFRAAEYVMVDPPSPRLCSFLRIKCGRTNMRYR
jgi:hypothetical protein